MGSKQQDSNSIGIKVEPLQSRIGALKYTKSDWTMAAFMLPRASIGLTFGNKEFQYNSIYFLFGYDGPTEKVYVGQAKKRNGGGSVLLRLREHDKSTTEPYRDIWQYAIVITSINDDWGPTELNNLEHLFYQEIPAKYRLNGNNPNFGGIDKDTDYSEKLRQAKTYIKTLGLQVFDDEDTEDTEKVQVESIINDYSTVEDLQNWMARIPEVITPHKVVKSMVDMLPSELFNPDTTFLDLACKGGEYLREIYDRLMKTESLMANYPDEFERSNHILEKQLFGIALSQVSMDRTIKSLKGYGHNIKVIHSYISYIKDKKDEAGQFKAIINRELGQMKFDVIIGNPPYQEGNGSGNGSGANSLYEKFFDKALQLNPSYISMITKPLVMNPNEICTGTYLIVGVSDSISIIENIKSYLCTKFVRALMLSTLASKSINRDTFKFVPMQDFTKTWSDEELYQKYNLTQEEIDYIEYTIKPMS